MTELLAQSIGATRVFGHLAAVRDVDLQVAPREVVGLLGANGAGKTTLIRMLLGLLPPSRGEVRLFGQPPSIDTRRRLGYVPQGLGLYEDLTPAENMAFARAAFGGEALASCPRALSRCASSRSGGFPSACSDDSPSPKPSPTGPTCWSLTSPRPASIRSPGHGCGRRSATPPTRARECWSQPTTWTRQPNATAWW